MSTRNKRYVKLPLHTNKIIQRDLETIAEKLRILEKIASRNPKDLTGLIVLSNISCDDFCEMFSECPAKEQVELVSILLEKEHIASKYEEALRKWYSLDSESKRAILCEVYSMLMHPTPVC